MSVFTNPLSSPPCQCAPSNCFEGCHTVTDAYDVSCDDCTLVVREEVADAHWSLCEVCGTVRCEDCGSDRGICCYGAGEWWSNI